ncbi:MAG TPA: vitamin K-dependent gamma-carboxylase, partial [Candidatus Latescibacteria bacterium]|nr:vitamin K-dependent gamma-carboxylase [Candidatus Latescibacterota bacterium]
MSPSILPSPCFFWALWVLRLQPGIAYFYGGIAKINGDWLRGEPMRLWLSARTDFPMIRALFTEEWVVYTFSY